MNSILSPVELVEKEYFQKMKNNLYLLAFLFVSQLCAGQISQKTDQRGISNYYLDALLLPDSTVILSEGIQESGKLRAALKAENPFEDTLLWEITSNETSEVTLFNELIEIDENTFGVLGFRQSCCDCTQPIAFYQRRSIATGELLNEIDEMIPLDFMNNAFINSEYSVALTDWGFTVPNFSGNNQTIFNYSMQGDLISTYTLGNSSGPYSGFEGDFVGYAGNKIYRFDANGNALDSVDVSSDLYALASSQNALAALTDGTLTLFDSNLEITETVSLAEGSYHISGTNSGFTLVNDQNFYRINNSGSIEMEYEYTPNQNFEVAAISAQDNIYVLAGAKRSEAFSIDFITHQHAAWQLHDNEGFAQLWHTNLSLVDISIDALEINDSNFYIYYNASVSVTVANTGTFPVSSFYLNHAQSAGICFPFFEKKYYEESISHLGETTVTMQSISGYTLPPFATDSIFLKFCVFVTNPMDQMDWDVSDDSICISDYYFLSTEDIDLSSFVKVFPNPATDLIRVETELQLRSFEIFNAQGKQVSTSPWNTTNGIDISNLPPGFYLLTLQTDHGPVTKKINIQD